MFKRDKFANDFISLFSIVIIIVKIMFLYCYIIINCVLTTKNSVLIRILGILFPQNTFNVKSVSGSLTLNIVVRLVKSILIDICYHHHHVADCHLLRCD